MEVTMESRPCPMGCSNDDRFVLTGRDLLHNLPGNYTVVECKVCGLMRTNPRPTPGTIGLYYPDSYGPYKGTRVNLTQEKPGRISGFLKPLVRRLFHFNVASVPNLSPGRMLEIGCASGAFMHKMACNGWSVAGIEFADKAAQEARILGHDVYTGQLEDAPDPLELYDLVVGWMVLEHLHDPVVGLKKLYDWTNPGASLVLSVPNVDCFGFNAFSEKWYDLHLPNHLYHFTPSTIEALLRDSGWRVEKIFHQRILANLLNSIGYALQGKGFSWLGRTFCSPPKYTSYLLYPIAWLLSLVGQTGRMTIWARKA